MKVNVQKTLSDVLGDAAFGPVVARWSDRWQLVRTEYDDDGSHPEILVQHEDWTKFVWLCGEYAKKQKESST